MYKMLSAVKALLEKLNPPHIFREESAMPTTGVQ